MGDVINCLNGIWNFRVDPHNNGEANKWYLKGFNGQEVGVPAAWQSYDKKMFHYTGYAWYSKEFTVTNKKGNQRLFIRFEAVDYQTDVWLNGHYIGSHEGGYTPFQFEIGNYIKKGENLLVVRVYDPEDVAEIPHGKQGSWYSRVSGIWQDVKLLGFGRAFVENVFIRSDIEQGEACFHIIFNSLELLEEPVLEIDVSPYGSQEVIVSREFNLLKKDYRISIPDFKLWEIENPYLYDFTVILRDGKEIIDKFSSYFGMREIKIKDGKLFLNNKPLYIRGALDQAFWPEDIYRARDEEMIKDEILKAKDMGFNLLRKHIKTEDPHYLYWADRLGILIWEEPANYVTWTPQARERFKREYTRMVQRDYNHPSIIAWSIYNEEWGLEWKLRENKEMQQWLEEFYDYARSLDPGRLVCDNSGWAHVKTDLNDYHRYYAVPENYREWQEDLDKIATAVPSNNFVDGFGVNKVPRLISEFGIWGLPKLGQLSEKYSQSPPWFEGETGFDHEFKIPRFAKKNFQKYGLNHIFNDLDELARLTQEREYRGVKYLIEEIRKREEINGYVVTELTDIEWETNGFLTYYRDPKEFFALSKNFNGAVSIMLDFYKHNYWGGEVFSAVPFIINNTGDSLKGVLEWKLDETELQGSLPVNQTLLMVNKNDASLNFTLPDKGGCYTLKYRLLFQGKVIAKNREELTVTSRRSSKEKNKQISTYQLEDKFKEQLTENGYNLLEETTKVCLTSCIDTRMDKYLRQGGRAIFLAEKGLGITEKGFINFKKMVDGESWDRAASFNFMDQNLFPGLPIQKISGWEIQDLYASYVVSNLNDLNWNRIIAGTFYGWVGNFGATIMELPYGEGKLLVVTLKLVSNYNKQPIGTEILHHLIDYYLG